MTEVCIGLIVLVSFSALSNSGRIRLFEMGRACILPVKEKISHTYLARDVRWTGNCPSYMRLMAHLVMPALVDCV
jgi:hypothetical protein